MRLTVVCVLHTQVVYAFSCFTPTRHTNTDASGTLYFVATPSLAALSPMKQPKERPLQRVESAGCVSQF